jgi:hypothetical protein
MAQIDHVPLGIGGGTGALVGMWYFTKSITPAALAASIGTSEQSFASIGSPNDLVTTDQVLVLVPPGSPGTNCQVLSGRVTGAQTIAITFGNFTAVANTPAGGVHGFLILRS